MFRSVRFIKCDVGADRLSMLALLSMRLVDHDSSLQSRQKTAERGLPFTSLLKPSLIL